MKWNHYYHEGTTSVEEEANILGKGEEGMVKDAMVNFEIVYNLM